MITLEKYSIYSIRVTDKQKKKIQNISDELKMTVGNSLERIIDEYQDNIMQEKDIAIIEKLRDALLESGVYSIKTPIIQESLTLTKKLYKRGRK